MKFQINTFYGKQGGLQYIGLRSSSLTGYSGKEYTDLRKGTVSRNFYGLRKLCAWSTEFILIRFFKFKYYRIFTHAMQCVNSKAHLNLNTSIIAYMETHNLRRFKTNMFTEGF